MGPAQLELKAAWERIDSGQLEQAETICRELLLAHPDLVESEFALGVICFRKGDDKPALAHLERFLSHSPNEVSALGLTAQLLLGAGQTDRALELAKRAQDLRPDEGPMLLLHITGKAELAHNRPISALKAFRDLVQLDPAQPAGYLGAADAFLALGSSFDAAGLYARVAEIAPNKAVLMKLGALELKVGRPARALIAAERILTREDADLHANVLAGQSLIELDRIEDSEPFWQRANAVSPGNHWVELKHGSSLAVMGRFVEVEGHLQRSVSLEHRQGSAYQLISANRKITVGDEAMVERMERVFQDRDLVPTEQAALAFALGKAWDDLDDPGKAFSFYDFGHEIQREMLPLPFELDRMKEQFRTQQALFSSPPVEPAEPGGPPPIFVVGMMRSGTTLTEQILSAHSQVVGAGEIDFWTGSEVLIVDRSEPRFLPEAAQERVTAYRRILDSFGGGTRRVVDKHPANLNVIGMIHQVLPDAHIVNLRRSPIDIAVSLWAMHSDPYAPLTVSRQNIVDAIKLSVVQAEYWRQVLPADRFLDVRYEDLVCDPETWTRRILTFCGLSWEEACLNPSASCRKVRTPSVWQVRKPVFKTSIDRWKRFEPWLGEFDVLLETPP